MPETSYPLSFYPRPHSSPHSPSPQPQALQETACPLAAAALSTTSTTRRPLSFYPRPPLSPPPLHHPTPSTGTPRKTARPLAAGTLSTTTTTRRPSQPHAHRFHHLLILLLFFLMVFSRGQAAAHAVTRVFPLSSQMRLNIKMGDLTKAAVGAIVNAANERMLGGGGVDGAIHRAAGPRLYDACKATPEVRPGVRCPTGEARITKGFDLPASFVV